MTITLDVAAELEERLRAAARRQGIDMVEYARHALEAAVSADALPADGPALLRFWQQAGVIGMRPDIVDGPEHAAAIRREAELRDRSST